MKSLENYKVLLWDFDGVIMDSMPVREHGFRKVLEKYPEDEVELLIHFHRKNGGWSRYIKFRYFFEEIRKESITDEHIVALSQKFSLIMRELLLSKELLIKDSLAYIEANYQDQMMHVVSGSDGEELRFLCQQLGLSKYFISIHGSPTPKGELIKNLLASEQYSKMDVLMIGDAYNDRDAAFANEIAFAGYNNENLRSNDYLYVDSFFNLIHSS
ncbi:HAD hydrolase-like protein [Algoriphagus sp. C2-6-M1]|uniref:HAD family hydrolase n=1 Tax=Algoriphagus persicinus TaxID=3108754 RepID=UPI002B3A3669|nr:HAD family hydrolase [Algoriphagus sp. C2-6-M1]MEB2782433.1 HAD hydrolase-like protein [Algoriphagus sp. C2-6-M1]